MSAADESDGSTASNGSDDAGRLPGRTDVTRYLQWGGLIFLALLAAIATLQLYTSVAAAIGRFIDPRFVPVFRAAFNAVVLLLALAGIGLIARRMR